MSPEIIRKALATGFFHWMQLITTLLLLLLIGQISSQTDSSKKEILSLVTFHLFNPKYQWYWVVCILALKAVSTFITHYLKVQLPELIQNTIWLQTLENGNEIQLNSNFHSASLKTYAKSWFKGKVIFTADFLYLLVILFILIYLNYLIAIIWLAVFILAISIRYAFVQLFINKKKIYRSRKRKVVQKSKFIESHLLQLALNGRFKKEISIVKKRWSAYYSELLIFARGRAVTAIAIPTLFFSFLFLIISPSISGSIDNKTTLQIVLVLIYSQSPINRIFRVTENWRVIRNFRFARIQSNKESNNSLCEIVLPTDLYAFIETDDQGLARTTNELHLEIFRKSIEMKLSISNAQLISEQVAFFKPHDTMIGETILAELNYSNEFKTMAHIKDMNTELGHPLPEDFDWYQNASTSSLSKIEIQWIHFYGACLHPSKLVISRSEDIQQIGEKQLEKIKNYLNKKNKIWVTV